MKLKDVKSPLHFERDWALAAPQKIPFTIIASPVSMRAIRKTKPKRDSR